MATAKPRPACSLALLLSALLLGVAAATAGAADQNSSALGGLAWSTGKDENDLLVASAEVTAGDDIEFADGFPSLESMLQWAIGNSDPQKLKERAGEVSRMSEHDLEERREEIKDLMEKLKMPSDAELMKTAIADLNNSSISLQDRQRALNELLVLVEPIDNANDLDKLGGLAAVIQELHNADADIRTTSAWILGLAGQNNALVQNQILEYGALSRLMKMVYSSNSEEAGKALYAVSSLIRNNKLGQELFSAEDGKSMLKYILTSSTVDTRLQKKAAFLIADLADFQQTNPEGSTIPFLTELHFVKLVVDLTSTTDIDLQEKILLAIKSLLQISTSDAVGFRDYCDLNGKLERVRVQLKELSLQEEPREHALEMEKLCGEVEATFNQKLQQISSPVA